MHSMIASRRVRHGLGAGAVLAAALGATFAPALPAVAAQPQPMATVTPLPARPFGGAVPTPQPINTPGPLPVDAALPYPAYGTPVPGVDAGVAAAGIPASIALPEAIAIGFARSPALAAARADVGIAQAAVRLAGAGLLPSVAGSASVDRSHTQPGAGSSSLGSATGAGGSPSSAIRGVNTTNFTQAAFAVQVRQLIYDGGRIAASVRAARRSESAFADVYRRQLQTVAYNVAVAYYNYLAAQRTRQVDLEIVRQDQTQENLVRAQVRAGTEARAQIATAQLPTAQARLAVIRAQSSELSAGAAFANAMGLDANVRVQPIDDAPVFTGGRASPLPIPAYDAALARAIALRPDYDAARQSLAQANENLRAARLGRSPSLAGTASAQDASSDPNAGSFRASQSIGLALSLPIFDQGLTRANSASAAASVDRATANLQATGLTIALNIKQALTNLVSSQAALDQTQQEYATAISNVRATQAQYRAGVTTLPLLLNAQVQLAQALTDQVNAVYALRQAEQTYLFAVGANDATSAAPARGGLRPR
ncbi:MAG: TolC family type I secretion outer membrane protein [Vulcanimicrobiaceae bacterium]